MNNNNQIELKRLAGLELLRTPENNHFIDEARQSGSSVEDTALKIVKDMVEADEATTEIVGYMNEIVSRRKGMLNNAIRQSGPYSYVDIDGSLTMEEQNAINTMIDEAKEIYKQRNGSSRL